MIFKNGRCLVLASLIIGSVLCAFEAPEIKLITGDDVIATRKDVQNIIKQKKILTYTIRALVMSAIVYSIYRWRKGHVEYDVLVEKLKNEVTEKSLQLQQQMQDQGFDSVEDFFEGHPEWFPSIDVKVSESTSWGQSIKQAPGKAWGSVKNIFSFKTVKNVGYNAGSLVKSFFTYEYLSHKIDNISTNSIVGVTVSLLFKGFFGMPTITWFVQNNASYKVTATNIELLFDANMSLQMIATMNTLRKQVCMLSSYLVQRAISDLSDEFDKKVVVRSTQKIIMQYNKLAKAINNYNWSSTADKHTCIDALREFIKMTDHYVDFFMTLFEEKIEFDDREAQEIMETNFDEEMLMNLSQMTIVLKNLDDNPQETRV